MEKWRLTIPGLELGPFSGPACRYTDCGTAAHFSLLTELKCILKVKIVSPDECSQVSWANHKFSHRYLTTMIAVSRCAVSSLHELNACVDICPLLSTKIKFSCYRQYSNSLTAPGQLGCFTLQSLVCRIPLSFLKPKLRLHEVDREQVLICQMQSVFIFLADLLKIILTVTH
jgi:hypothetical protein